MRWVAALIASAACGRFDFGTSAPADSSGDGPRGDVAHANIAFVQSDANAASPSNAMSVSFVAKPKAGNTIIVAVSTYSGDVTVITDNATNNYIGLTSNPRITGPGTHLYVFYALNIGVAVTSSHTVNVQTATGGTNDLSVAIFEYAGATALDQQAGASGTGTAIDSGSVITATDGELLFGATARDNTAVTSAGAGYTLREVPSEDGGSFVPLATEDILAAPAGTASASFSVSLSSTWDCELATFR